MDRSSNYKVLSQQFKNTNNHTVVKNNNANSAANSSTINNAVINNDNLGLPSNNSNSNSLNHIQQSKSPNFNETDSLKVKFLIMRKNYLIWNPVFLSYIFTKDKSKT